MLSEPIQARLTPDIPQPVDVVSICPHGEPAVRKPLRDFNIRSRLSNGYLSVLLGPVSSWSLHSSWARSGTSGARKQQALLLLPQLVEVVVARLGGHLSDTDFFPLEPLPSPVGVLALTQDRCHKT